MRLSVTHTETFTYDQPALGTIQVLRLTPRDFDGHYVCDWSVDVDADCRLDTKKDAFGNIVTSFSLPGPLETLTITARGEVETDNIHGIVRGTAEKVPTGVFLRPMTADKDAAATRLLIQAQPNTTPPALERMHALMGTLHAALPSLADDADDKSKGEGTDGRQKQEGASQSQSQESAAEPSPAAKRLAVQLADRNSFSAGDAAMILADAARHYGLPARLIEGYRLDGDKRERHLDQRDVWCEVLIDGLGWVGFDAMEKSCPSEESIRVAAGLDGPTVSAVRAGHYGTEPSCERQTVIALSRIGG
ncbi:MAG: transglutaminase N-terminal domain-containing protein [Cohaesibacteraceae bacterium]